MSTVCILGGSGNVGRILAEILLDASDVSIVLAGRTLARAESIAAELNAACGSQRVTARHADAADEESLHAAFDGAALVVVSAPVATSITVVARAAITAGADVLDLLVSDAKVRALQALAPEAARMGRTIVTDGGFHPGLPALLVRALAPRVNTMTSARVGSVIRIDWAGVQLNDETARELVDALRDMRTIEVFRNGTWSPHSVLDSSIVETMTFDAPFLAQKLYPMPLGEMRQIPTLFPSLTQTGFLVGGFNPVTDTVILPIAMLVLWLAPRRGVGLVSRMLRFGLQRFSRPPFATILRTEARGEDGAVHTLTVSHPDGYRLTAIPAASCCLQLLDGSARSPGVVFQALTCDPTRTLDDLARFGATVTWG